MRISEEKKMMYEDCLNDFRARAKELFPNKTVFNQKECSEIAGCSLQYIRSRTGGHIGLIPISKLAWIFIQ